MDNEQTSNRRFEFRIPNTLGMLVAVAICLNLAHWQYGRILEKKQLQADYETSLLAKPWNLNELDERSLETLDQHEWQPISVNGRFLPEFGFYLDSQVYKGKPGYNYIVPMEIDGNQHLILVNLGWISAGSNRLEIPAFPEISAKQPIKGQLARPKAAIAGFEQTQGESRVHLFIDIPALSARIGGAESPVPFVPMLIQLDEQAHGTLPRQWPKFNAKVEMHEFYVAHWLLVALAIFLIYLYFGFRTPGKKPEQATSEDHHE